MLGAIIPRVGVRLASKIPPPLPGNALEHLASKASHGFLYFAAIFMPVSGLSFGYASGWGVPFFWTDVPGAPKEKAESPPYKAVEKFMYENHHRVGQVLTYVLPIHIGAAGYHVLKGHKIFHRMNPFV
jgi:cytochrome b561